MSFFQFPQLVDIRVGDCLDLLRAIPDNSIDCCITSPPYFNLRNYGIDGQIGLEQTPNAYIDKLVDVFREVRRTLKDDATLWLNLGDSYAANGGAHGGRTDNQRGVGAKRVHENGAGDQERRTPPPGAKPKDLLMIPARVALALQADGWWLRSDIIWHKPAPMPESVRDRFTCAHEHVFLLAKSASYFFDAKAVAEPSVMRPQNRLTDRSAHPKGDDGRQPHTQPPGGTHYETRNRRNVWTIANRPFKGAHFAIMPPELAEICMLAGTSAMGHCPECGNRWSHDEADNWKAGCECQLPPVPDVVLDPFGGAGTTGYVAQQLGRKAILIELNPSYAEIARNRIKCQ